jgi:hypothetical protein
MPTIHFKSEEDERKSDAYRHIHDIPAPKRTVADVAGKKHRIKHSTLNKPGKKKSTK